VTANARSFRSMDRTLTGFGIPPCTRWWDPTLERFLDDARLQTLAAEVGRAGAKSHTLTKCGAHQVLFGDWRVPPRERHYFAFVSENKSEASQRLRLLETILRTLEVPFTRAGDEIALDEKPLGFRVFACQIGAVSGFRCIGFAADEVAKWDSAGANPAAEIIASLRAMTITHPNAREFIVSSPVGKAGFHFELCRSKDPAVHAVNAPSWIANPDAITEAETRRRERDPRIWAREYAAIPQDAALSAFDYDDVERAFRHVQITRRERFGRAFVVTDWSGGKRDATTWGLAQWWYPAIPFEAYTHQVLFDGNAPYWQERDSTPKQKLIAIHEGYPPLRADFKGETKPFLFFREIDGVEGRYWGEIDSDELVGRVADLGIQWGATDVFGDQFGSVFLVSGINRRRLNFIELAWNATNKTFGVEHLRALFRERRIVFPPAHAKLRAELHSFEEKISASGGLTFQGRGSTHDDYAILAIQAAVADLEGHLDGSPTRRSTGGRRFRSYDEDVPT